MATNTESGRPVRPQSGGGSQSDTPRPGLMPAMARGLGALLRARPASAGAQTVGGKRPSKFGMPLMRFFFGMIVFVVGSEVFAYLEYVIDGATGHKLTNAPWVAASTPVLGGLRPYLLVYFLAIIAWWFALYKFKILPRDPFGVRNQQPQRARSAASPPGAGSGRTRADRRHATTTTAAKSSTSARQTAATTRTVIAGGPDDAIHQRVRAAQRARRRRETRR